MFPQRLSGLVGGSVGGCSSVLPLDCPLLCSPLRAQVCDQLVRTRSRGGAEEQANTMIHILFLSLMCRGAEGDVPRCSNEDIGNKPFCFPSNYNKVK